MLARPPDTPAVGVKIAVRVLPVPLMALSVPPETSTSPVLPFQLKELPGSSLKVKVMVAVCPPIRADLSLLMLSVGARVSMLTEGVTAATPALPAVSW